MSVLVYDLYKNPRAAEDDAYSDLFGDPFDNGPEATTTTFGNYYESGIDAVYTVRIRNDYCFVAFRGTTGKDDVAMDDMLSNFDVDPVWFDVEDDKDEEEEGARSKRKEEEYNDENSRSCDIHNGFYDSYFNFEHRSSGVEDFIRNCSGECPGCDVVLTGHSQGGAIAEVAALDLYGGETRTTNDAAAAVVPNNNNNNNNLYVVTFGAPQGLGAGCLPLFAKEERCRFYRYVMTTEGPLGRGLVYDPVPMGYPRALGDFDNDGVYDGAAAAGTYARNGGLAFVGHELFLNAGNPSAIALGPFDGHYGVEASKYDWTKEAHGSEQYASVLIEQSRQFYYNYGSSSGSSNGYESSNDDKKNNCYLSTDGFSLGSLCNTDESSLHCTDGVSECKRNGWWWGSENTCQAIDDGDSSSVRGTIEDRFCHKALPNQR